MNLTCSATRKQITIFGINSRFGKAVSFLLKQSPIANRLVLYDETNTDVAHDLSAINTTCKVVVYNGEEQIRCAVKNSDLILIGDKEDPGPNVDDSISKAAPDIIKYAEAISCSAPKAIVLVAASPVNTMMSLFSEVQMRLGTFDSDRVMGVTSVDTMRASTVLARHMNLNPEKVHLPVIGGSSPDTRIPLFSQSRPAITVCKADLRKMTRMVKMSECELFKLFNRGDALNKAYATVRLIDSVMSALRGQRNISEIVLSRTCLVPDVDYFSLPVILGPRGIAHRFPIPTLTERENILLEHAVKFIQIDKQKAIDIVCRRAESHEYQLPQKTKEYSDLFECDKKGIFVGALLDKLRIRKEACKPKLEYLLMNKNNDLVYPPECEPCTSPKLIKFVEPDQFPNDGCCPMKLPCPPSPPKRGLTVTAPKKLKCEMVAAPCPYPPVVKLPKTCNLCGRDSPCEHYANCKNLYGDTKSCRNVQLPFDKSEQTVTHLTSSSNETAFVPQEDNATVAGGEKQVLADQQFNSFVQNIDEHPHSSSGLMQSMTDVHSMPLTTRDDSKANSVETAPNVTTNSRSIALGTDCPYGMSAVDTPEPGHNLGSLAPVCQYNQTNLNVTNGSRSSTQLGVIPHSEPTEQSRVDSKRDTSLHSFSGSLPGAWLQSPNAIPNEDHAIQHGLNVHSIHMNIHGYSVSPASKTPESSSCTDIQCPKTFPQPRNINEAIDQCLSKICVVEINSVHKPAPPTFDKNLHTVVAEPSSVATSSTSVFQDESNSTAPSTPTATKPVLEEEISTMQKTQCGSRSNVDGGVEQVQNDTGIFNYKGGLGIPPSQSKTDPNNPLFPFNPWSSHREEQYYNARSGNDEGKKFLQPIKEEEKLSEATEETPKPNENLSSDIQKPPNAENTTRSSVNSGVNDCSSSVLHSKGMNWSTGSCTMEVSTGSDKRHALAVSINEQESKGFCRSQTDNKVNFPATKFVSEEFLTDQDTSQVDFDTRMRKNIRARIHNVRMQNSIKNRADNTKLLGFGQIINALIPSTKFSKTSRGKSSKGRKRSRTVNRQLYVQTHNNHKTDISCSKSHENKDNVMIPIATPSDHKYCAQSTTKNNSASSKIYDVPDELSKLAIIRCRVQAALKNIVYPPVYKQKPADKVVKQEQQIERLTDEKLKRSSKVIKDRGMEDVHKFESALQPEGQKLYAPKCPRRLIFGNHPDSRVMTFNNVRELDVSRVKTESVASAGEIIPCPDQTVTFVSKKGEESNVGKKHKISDSCLPTAYHYVEKPDINNADKINPTVEYLDFHNSEYWTEKPEVYSYQAPQPVPNQQYDQNQPPLIQKSTRAQPTFNKDYLKHILEQKISREKRTEAHNEQLEFIIKERSKKVMTPGGVRLARIDDPKYGLTSPNRIMTNR